MRKDIEIVADTPASYEICFEQALDNNAQSPVVASTGFTIKGPTNLQSSYTLYFEDDTNGKLLLYRINDEGVKVYQDDIDFGTVDYATGELMIGYTDAVTFTSTLLPGKEIQVRAVPLGQDIVAKKSVYLELDIENSKIDAVVDREIQNQ